jgi:hypothetical protein
MIYTVEIRESDISIDEKFIAVILEKESEDSPVSVFDVATSNDISVLRKWANDIIKN